MKPAILTNGDKKAYAKKRRQQAAANKAAGKNLGKFPAPPPNLQRPRRGKKKVRVRHLVQMGGKTVVAETAPPHDSIVQTIASLQSAGVTLGADVHGYSGDMMGVDPYKVAEIAIRGIFEPWALPDGTVFINDPATTTPVASRKFDMQRELTIYNGTTAADGTVMGVLSGDIKYGHSTYPINSSGVIDYLSGTHDELWNTSYYTSSIGVARS